MRSVLPASLLALAALAGATAAARADVFIQVPYVTVRVGRPRPAVPVAAPVYAPPSTPADFGAPPPVPGAEVPPPAVPVARVPTLSEFAASFRPLPGTYKVVLQHPVTCAPVEVC